MQSKRMLTVLVVCLMLTGGAGWASSAPQPGYVALGDSIDSGVGGPTTGGFVRLLHEQALGTEFELHKLAVPGADTKAITRDQLPVAVSEVVAHAPYGVVVTIGGGGVDLRRFIMSSAGQACRQTDTCRPLIEMVLDGVEKRLDVALRQLRYADPEATILVRTQYNPLRRSGCASPDLVELADAALEAPPGDELEGGGLNWRLRELAARHGALVIEIFDAFAAEPDLLIRYDCTHPTDAGHVAIFDAAVDALTP